MTLEGAGKDKSFYLHYCDSKITLKQEHAYYYQLQGAIYGNPSTNMV